MLSAALVKWQKWAFYGLLGGGICVVFCLFFQATTFLGDDYLFRTFARFEPNPLIAFYEDKHGGEYYRPLPMLLWWVLERASGGRSWPFALFALGLHTLCAWLLARLARQLGGPATTQWMAALLCFFSPAQLEAALWFSASTDLLCAVCILASLLLSLAPRRLGVIGSWICAALALVSKETAIILPALILTSFYFAQRTRNSWFRIVMRTIPYLMITLVYLGLRFMVLGGVGGTHDPKATLPIRGVQVLAGLCHAVVGYGPGPEVLLLLLGAAALAWAGWTYRRHGQLAAFAWVFVLLSVAPLPLAGWVVGARYFYLAGAGLALVFASILASRPSWILNLILTVFLVQNLVLAQHRMAEIRRYEKTIAVAKIALLTTMETKGTRFFVLRGAVKDLDLAVKLDQNLPLSMQQIVVIPDVPASFIRVPHDYYDKLRFLFAIPPLPPSGAYRWGSLRVVGLARREEAPDLDQVVNRFPGLAFLQLETSPEGIITWKDRTNQLHDP
jgi:hypothetical protein